MIFEEVKKQIMIRQFGFILFTHLMIAVPMLDAAARLEYIVESFFNTPVQTINFKASGFPTETPLTLIVRRLDNFEMKHEVKIDQKNRLIDLQNGKEMSFVFGNFANGEPMNCTLTDDQVLIATCDIFPNPIHTFDKTGHTLMLKMTSPNAEIFELTATGFKPNEKFQLYSKSESEKIIHNVQADSEGNFKCVLLPAVIGLKTGHATVQLSGKTTDNLKVKYIWGEDAFKYERKFR